ncbi:MAG TPA: hypothetical protein VF407_18025 [Polyangiaceae bacterium]
MMSHAARRSTHFRIASAPGHTVERRVGRLLEVRIRGPVRTVQEVMDISNGLRREIEKAGGDKLIIMGDYRQATVFSPERFDDWQALMRSVTPYLERSALIFEKKNATFNLQLQRAVLRMGSPFRKMFYEADEAKSWLESVLDGTEYVRLAAFLAESK